MNKRFYLFGAVALPLLMASCSNDLLDAEQGSQELVNGNVAKVDSDFRLFAERSTGNQTRGEWINGDKGTVFYWMPAGVVLQEDVADPTLATDHSRVAFAVDPLPVYTPGTPNLTFDEVGLCWLGAGEVGENIFTNYKFVHDGWLEDGATTTSDEIVDCDQNTAEYLKNWNWVKYADYGVGAGWAAEGKKLTITPETGKVVGTLGAKVNAYDAGVWKDATKQHQIEKINLSKGTFRTENKSIFTGKYLAYYPYDEAMVEQGRLVAKTVTEQDAPIGYNDRMLQAGDYTFLAGYMAEEIKGGSVASALTMNPISGLLSVKLDKATCANNIQHMIVMSANGEIAETMGLKASAIKAGNELDGADATYTQKVIVHFKDKSGAAANFRFDNYNTAATGSNEDTYNRVIVPVLPGEISDLDLFLITATGKAQTTKNTQKVTVNKGAAVGVVTGSVNNDIYVAWDKASLKTAITYAGAETSNQTILIINKIVLDEDINVPRNITITGEWRNQKVGELVVAASNTTSSNILTAQMGSAFNCDITVEGVGCCHKKAGIMEALGITFKAGSYADGHKNKLVNNGLVAFTSTSTPGDLRVNKFDGDIENTPLKYKVAGVPTVDPATGVAYQLPFEAADYKFDFASPTDFEGSVIAIYTQATVEINSTLNNKTTSNEAGNTRRDALVILEKRNDAVYPNNNQDARLVINENAVVDNFATVKNQATVANNSGKAAGFKNEVHATFVNMIGGQLNGYKMQKEANSNFIAQVDNSIDSRYATALQEHLANIIEFLPLNTKYTGAAQAMTYTMEGVNNKDLKYLVNAGTETVTLVGKKTVDDPKATVEATIGAIEVAAGCQLDINYSQGATINTTSPVCLNVENGIYNNTHKAVDDVLINNRYPVAIPAVITDASTSKFNLYTNRWDGVTFNTVGDVEFNGVEFIGLATTYGFNLPIVTIKGNMTVAGETTVDQKVVKGTVDGNLTIASTGTMNFNSDVKFKVGVDENTTAGMIQNNGTFNIESNVIISSPAIVYCKKYNLDGGTWLNGGRPTPFDAGGVVPGDYNW